MLTIAIPTYERGEIVCETIERLLHLDPPADEIVIVDQTATHPPEVAARLHRWETDRAIRVIRLPRPSIPHAMNVALAEARNDHVLFLDDDVVPAADIIGVHERAWRDPALWAVVGQVLQPGEEPHHYEESELRGGVIRDLEFRFNHDAACEVQNVMAGHLSVDRNRALSIGGFDEAYVAVAYRFESDFALRLIAAGGRIRYEPAASIRHLKAATGGVRSWGDHRRSASPAHAFGDYYFARKHAPSFWRYVAVRLRKNVITRYHATHPWTIPGKLIGEARALIRAVSAA